MAIKDIQPKAGFDLLEDTKEYKEYFTDLSKKNRKKMFEKDLLPLNWESLFKSDISVLSLGEGPTNFIFDILNFIK